MMQIRWAIFGERNGGHALLAASANTEIATKITQYTDRPGDPPFGLEWGPVVSGFYFADHYILMRTLPDTMAGRAGMVRSYAAFLPASELGSIENLTSILTKMPSDLSKPAHSLSPITIEVESLRAINTGQILPGLDFIARRLCSSDPVIPLVWSSTDSYLPTIDAVWAKLPSGLRSAFAFSFQFAPEHKLPVTPTIVATLPALASRWPAAQIIYTGQPSFSGLNTAQKWFTGLSDESGFTGVLSDYGIVVKEFKELNILSSFTDMVVRLPQLSFVELTRAVRILEKHSRLTAFSAKRRGILFEKLCILVPESSAKEIERLRNFNPKALADLISPLQDSMRKWIKSFLGEINSLENYSKTLELAVDAPDSWWSVPFIEWLGNLAISPALFESKILCRLISVSVPLTDFFSARLPSDDVAEVKIIAGMPATFSRTESENILKLSKQRDWMRMHATCLLRTYSKTEAVMLHAKVVNRSTAGFDLIYQELGLVAFLQAACGQDNEALDNYAGHLIYDHCDMVPRNFGADCERWPILLDRAVSHSRGPLDKPLRQLVITALKTQPPKGAGATKLYEASSRDVRIILAMEQPSVMLGHLSSKQKSETLSKINAFVLREVMAGQSIELKDADAFRELLDISAILNGLRTIPVEKAASVGVIAFRSLSFLTDSEFRLWLINLFTRTQHDPLDATATVEISELLLSRDYPLSAKVVRDTVNQYGRKDVSPILTSIRYKYDMAKEYAESKKRNARLPKVLIATALPLERSEVMKYLNASDYDSDLFADIAHWPVENPVFEIFVLATGPGNLGAQNAVLRVLKRAKPKFAFFVGVGGGVKDSEIGDVVYGTKVYYVEGGKEEKDGFKSRPASENTSEALVQLAHRISETGWQPACESTNFVKPKATPAVVASGEKVLASTSKSASSFHNLKTNYNDTQVVDMEAYGFLLALRTRDVKLCMVIRGVSDKIKGKGESDANGNQPLAAQNAAAFLFALLRACPSLMPSKKKQRSIKSIFTNLFADPNTLP